MEELLPVSQETIEYIGLAFFGFALPWGVYGLYRVTNEVGCVVPSAGLLVLMLSAIAYSPDIRTATLGLGMVIGTGAVIGLEVWRHDHAK
jgi:hypothetical protein